MQQLRHLGHFIMGKTRTQSRLVPWSLVLWKSQTTPTIAPMRAREAKDFLVQQTAEQAQLDAVPLSDLEKRMMYFTESGEMPEDPIQLNDEFEARYNTGKYEAKVATLLHHPYQRASNENDET